jgi:hypothetical protein
LPTSLTYIILSARGCSPRRPAADMGTIWHGVKSLPRIFKDRRRSAWTSQEPRDVFRAQHPYLRLKPIPGSMSLKRKENSSRDPRLYLRVRLRYRTTAITRMASTVARFGILTRFPFARRATYKVILAGVLQAAYACGLGSTDPCATAVHMEPFSTSVLQGSHLNICYYHQDLH